MSYGRSVNRGPPCLSAKNFSVTTGKPVERLVSRQQLRAVHIGRRLRIRTEHLEAYLNAAEGEQEATPCYSDATKDSMA
jgi:excisionase family DNA binding protein